MSEAFWSMREAANSQRKMQCDDPKSLLCRFRSAETEVWLFLEKIPKTFTDNILNNSKDKIAVRPSLFCLAFAAGKSYAFHIFVIGHFSGPMAW